MALQHFLNLDKEKQKVIRDAAFDEFLEYGYDLASTNRIVEKAGIAKGTLFKYFSSKEELIGYLAEYCSEVIGEAVLADEKDIPQDFIESLKRISWRKYYLSFKYPREFGLLMLIWTNQTHPVYQKIFQDLMEKGRSIMAKAPPVISPVHLRSDIPVEKAMLMVTWMISGFEEYMRKNMGIKEFNLEQMQKAMDELEPFFEMLKHGIYEQPATKEHANGKNGQATEQTVKFETENYSL